MLTTDSEDIIYTSALLNHQLCSRVETFSLPKHACCTQCAGKSRQLWKCLALPQPGQAVRPPGPSNSCSRLSARQCFVDAVMSLSQTEE